MQQQTELTNFLPDPAAQFASSLSLWQTAKQEALIKGLNLTECYNGMDQFMREVVRVANQFEAWACVHVDFDMLDDVWPYLLEERFGAACLAVLLPDALTGFDDNDCLRVALHLRLPIKLNYKLPVPIYVKASNPTRGSTFHEFLIQTLRNSIDGEFTAPFTLDNDPFDDTFAESYLGLYGVGDDGLLEHIADRATYAEAISLAQKLAPRVVFPIAPPLNAGSEDAPEQT